MQGDARREGAWPAPSALLPHAGPMCWLDRVLEHGQGGTRCSGRVRADSPLRDECGRVPAVAAIEWMAQCAAVHAALGLAAEAETSGARLERVLLLGTRSLALARGWLHAGERLQVFARPAAAATSGLVTFEARVRDVHEREIASATLNLLVERVRPLDAATRAAG